MLMWLQKLAINFVCVLCLCALVSPDSEDVGQTASGVRGVQRVKHTAPAAGHRQSRLAARCNISAHQSINHSFISSIKHNNSPIKVCSSKVYMSKRCVARQRTNSNRRTVFTGIRILTVYNIYI